jgi:hypothetical protein
MTAIFTFAAVIGLATLLGCLVRWLTRRLPSRALRVRLSVAAGILSLVTGLAVMWRTGSLLPASDDSMFGARTSIKAEFFHDSSKLKTEDIRIEVTVPRVVRVDNDAVVDLILGDNGTVLPPGSYSTVLESSGIVEMRTTTPCNSGSRDVALGMNSSASCSERPRSASVESHFRWFVRSTKPSESYLTVKWPDQIGKTMNRGKQWVARLKRNGQVIYKPAAHAHGSFPWPSPSPGQFQLSELPELLSAKQPTYRADFEVDCASQQFTLPVRFQTTLGVSAATYSNLSLLGAILSGFLGGGWLWQLIPWLSRRKNEPSGRDRVLPDGSRFTDEQFDAYRDVWASLQNLREVAQSLWSDATKANLDRFKQSLEETRRKVEEAGIFFSVEDWNHLRYLLHRFSDFYAGKESLIRYRYDAAKRVREPAKTSSGHYEFVADQIEKNRNNMNEYNDLLEKLRRTYHDRLSANSDRE